MKGITFAGGGLISLDRKDRRVLTILARRLTFGKPPQAEGASTYVWKLGYIAGNENQAEPRP